jgi:hypothetical protein
MSNDLLKISLMSVLTRRIRLYFYSRLINQLFKRFIRRDYIEDYIYDIIKKLFFYL